jgi:hypothetical protein
MKTLILILLPLFGLSQIQTTSGEIYTDEIEVYLVDFDKKRDAHKISIDTGTNCFPVVIDDQGKEVYVQSPVGLKVFMESMGYSYIKSEMYNTYIPDQNIFTVRYFKRSDYGTLKEKP